jgi:hypothetical protein
MGIPDFVDSPHHHTPSDAIAFAQRHPRALVLVTHNFASATGVKEGFRIPVLPESIIQLEDGDYLDIGEDGQLTLQRNP